MEAKDLRIGNYIRDIESQRKGYVLTIGKRSSTVKMEFSELTQKFEEYEPIELTEEWLLKMGVCILNKNSTGIKYAFMNESKMVMIASMSFTVWNNGKIDSHPEHLTSVHSVQNAFHALTGEELTINEGK